MHSSVCHCTAKFCGPLLYSTKTVVRHLSSSYKLAYFRSWTFAQPRFRIAMQAQNGPGHSVPSSSVVYQEAEDPEVVAFQEHQRTAARLTLADEARTLVALARWGMLCTNSRGDLAGYPGGSVVEFAATEDGRPCFAFSSLSPHTGDLQKDSRASFVVTAPDFKGLSEARVSITGSIVPAGSEVRGSLKATYKARNPSSFWVDFGDFTWFYMEDVKAVRVVGGFARAGTVNGAEYLAATVDPVAQFSGPVCGHMNADHAEATAAIVKHYVGITVQSAQMLNIDRLGMNVTCTRDGATFKCRVPWSRPAEDRKSVKDVIVEMTRAATAAAQPQPQATA